MKSIQIKNYNLYLNLGSEGIVEYEPAYDGPFPSLKNLDSLSGFLKHYLDANIIPVVAVFLPKDRQTKELQEHTMQRPSEIEFTAPQILKAIQYMLDKLDKLQNANNELLEVCQKLKERNGYLEEQTRELNMEKQRGFVFRLERENLNQVRESH